MGEIAPQMGDPPRAESPGERDQKLASWLVEGASYYLRMRLTKEAVAVIARDVRAWWGYVVKRKGKI